MSRRGRFVVAALGLVLLAVGIAFALFVRRPLATMAFLQRRGLAGAGFERVELGGERLVLFRAGSGPPLLFLHGLGDQAGSWAEVAPRFTASHRVLVADLPGHGASAPATGPLAMATLAAGAERLLAEAARDGRVTVVGNSLGGWLATLLAHRHPGQVERLVLVNGGALRGDEHGLSLQPRDRREAAALLARMRDAGAPPVPGFVLDDVVRAGATGPIARLAGDLAGFESHLLDGRLGDLATPVDLLWGVSDAVVPLAYAERLLAALPAARLTPLERCGHVPQVECPERFLGALEPLLAAPPPAPRPTPPTPPDPGAAAESAGP
ncbi:MAG TPA: alpha/beta fold hydrolase [Thermoanaerobaculia bacterium]|nr:alpha/beta fold hydrolase [Thermoanaerobaculia bacterium]